MPIETNDAGITITGHSIELYRVLSLRNAISLYLKTGLRVNRAYTPTNMLVAASQYTGVQYKRGKRGLQQAFDDLDVMIQSSKGADPDAVGEAFKIVREGGLD